MLKQDSTYTWRLQDDVINVFPRVNRDEVLNDILLTRVRECVIKQDIHMDGLRVLLTYMPEIKSEAQKANVSPLNLSLTGADHAPIGLSHPLKMSNATLREILNTVIRESRTNFWHALRGGRNNEDLIVSF